MAYYDKHYENMKYFDLLASVLSCSNELSERQLLYRSKL